MNEIGILLILLFPIILSHGKYTCDDMSYQCYASCRVLQPDQIHSNPIDYSIGGSIYIYLESGDLGKGINFELNCKDEENIDYSFNASQKYLFYSENYNNHQAITVNNQQYFFIPNEHPMIFIIPPNNIYINVALVPYCYYNEFQPVNLFNLKESESNNYNFKIIKNETNPADNVLKGELYDSYGEILSLGQEIPKGDKYKY